MRCATYVLLVAGLLTSEGFVVPAVVKNVRRCSGCISMADKTREGDYPHPHDDGENWTGPSAKPAC